MFNWRSTWVNKAFISKMVNVLDNRIYFTPSGSLFYCSSLFCFATYFVACKCFSKDSDEWAITREKYAVEFRVLVQVLCCDIEADKSFACTGNTRNKTD